MTFPSAEETLNEMLKAPEHPGSIARVRVPPWPWQYMPGPKLLKLLEGEVPAGTQIDYVQVPA